MFMEPIASLWAPVSKISLISKEQAAEQQRMWESGTDVLTFPAGACSRLQRIDGKWQIKDLEWQKEWKSQRLTFSNMVELTSLLRKLMTDIIF